MRNTGLEETQAGIKIARRNSNNLRYANDTTLWQKEELKSLLIPVLKSAILTRALFSPLLSNISLLPPRVYACGLG